VINFGDWYQWQFAFTRYPFSLPMCCAGILTKGDKLMIITLNLEPRIGAYLREKAAREGQAEEEIAQELIAWAIRSEFQSQRSVSLEDYNINAAQAAELRASLASFAEDWNQPQMDVYDNYDAAKAHIEAHL